MPNTIKPLGLGIASRRVLSDVVTDDLRQAIVDHELEPGRRISEDELAAQLDDLIKNESMQVQDFVLPEGRLVSVLACIS